LRVIAKANRLCPDLRQGTWPAEVETLAEIGRYDEARALLKEIEDSGDAASEEARAAAEHARRIVDERDRSFVDTDEAKAEMRELYGKAVETEAAVDKLRGVSWIENVRPLHAKASALFLQAWASWRPNGQALYGAGRNAKRAGRVVEAQRMFDRATVELQTGRRCADC
jgi:hypothetical protein